MTAAAIARAFEVVIPADVVRMVGCDHRTVRNMRVSGRIPWGRVSRKVAGALAQASGVPLDEILAGDGPGRIPPSRMSARTVAGAVLPPAGEATNGEEMDQFQALEKKRREDARIAALIREDKELSLALRRGKADALERDAAVAARRADPGGRRAGPIGRRGAGDPSGHGGDPPCGPGRGDERVPEGGRGRAGRG